MSLIICYTLPHPLELPLEYYYTTENIIVQEEWEPVVVLVAEICRGAALESQAGTVWVGILVEDMVMVGLVDLLEDTVLLVDIAEHTVVDMMVGFILCCPSSCGANLLFLFFFYLSGGGYGGGDWGGMQGAWGGWQGGWGGWGGGGYGGDGSGQTGSPAPQGDQTGGGYGGGSHGGQVMCLHTILSC